MLSLSSHTKHLCRRACFEASPSASGRPSRTVPDHEAGCSWHMRPSTLAHVPSQARWPASQRPPSSRSAPSCRHFSHASGIVDCPSISACAPHFAGTSCSCVPRPPISDGSTDVNCKEKAFCSRAARHVVARRRALPLRPPRRLEQALRNVPRRHLEVYPVRHICQAPLCTHTKSWLNTTSWYVSAASTQCQIGAYPFVLAQNHNSP